MIDTRPKFRAWFYDDKRMLHHKLGENHWYTAPDASGKAVIFPNGDHHETALKRAVIMQATGMKDDLGQDIYEGDIMRVGEDMSDPATSVHFVVYHGHTWDYPAFDLVPGEECECNNLSHFKASGFMQVIGNIHENSELLEKP